MSEEKKPREFWIEETVTMGGSRFWATDYEDPGMKNVIHVREVMPNDPDWRALCEEVADTIDFLNISSGQKFEQSTKMLLSEWKQKYEAAKGEKND